MGGDRYQQPSASRARNKYLRSYLSRSSSVIIIFSKQGESMLDNEIGERDFL